MSSPHDEQARDERIDARVLAIGWLLAYSRFHKPLSIRLLSLIPVIALPVGILAGPAVLWWALAVNCLWLMVFVPLWARQVRREQPLLGPLTELAAFPHPTSEGHVRVVGRCMCMSVPLASRSTRPTAQQQGEVLRETALRLFVVSDAEGCGDGHSDVCAHRRDTLAWWHWIAPEAYPAPPSAPPSTSPVTAPGE